MTPKTPQEAADHSHAHKGQPLEDITPRLIANKEHQKSRLLFAKSTEYQTLVQEACEQSRRVVAAVRESRERRQHG